MWVLGIVCGLAILGSAQDVAALVAFQSADTTDLSITKLGTAGVDSGDTIRYSIQVRNGGAKTAVGVVVSDTLPSGSRFLNASNGGRESTRGVVTWDPVPSLAASATLTYTLEILAPGVGTEDPVLVTNVATVTSGTPDPDPTNNVDAFRTIVEGKAPEISIQKLGPQTVNSGDSFTYTLTVTVSGSGADARNVAITDTLPSRGSIVSFSGSGTLLNGVIVWDTIAVVPAGSVLNYQVHFRAPAGPRVLRNVSAVTTESPETDLSDNRSFVDTRVVAPPAARLTIEKVALPGVIKVGDEVDYRITVRNVGSAPATQVQVSDTLPPTDRATFVAASGGVLPQPPGGRLLVWPTIPVLLPGDSALFTVRLRILAPEVLNTATAKSPETGAVVDTAFTRTPPLRDLEIKRFGASEAGLLDTLTFTIHTTSTKPADLDPAFQVVVLDSLPSGLQFVKATGGGVANNGVIRWFPRTLNAGDTLIDSVTVVVRSSGALTSVARVAWAQDSDSTNNRAATTTTVPDLDVALTKTVVESFAVGSPGRFLLTVTNVGSVPTVGPVTVTDTLPAGLVFGGGSGPGWSVSHNNSVVTGVFAGTLGAGETAAFTIAADVAPAAAACFTNRATASTLGDAPDGPLGANNTASAEACVPGELFLRKAASVAVADITDQIDYVLTVGVVGPAAVDSVTVEDRLPHGFRYVPGTARLDGTPGDDRVSRVDGLLTFDIGTILGGDSVRVSYRLSVGPGADLGDGINRARARSPRIPETPLAEAKVEVRRGPFDDEGIILGKIFVDCSCDDRFEQGEGELGIPGVRVFLQDGSSVLTDSEGKYSFYGISPRTWIVKVDRSSLPDGARLIPLSNRHGNDGSSAFVDLKRGELHRADFAEGSASNAVRTEVQRRREQSLRNEELRLPAEASRVDPSRMAGGRQVSAFRPVLPDFMLTDRNTRLPAAPGVLEVPQGGGLRDSAPQPLSRPQSEALNMNVHDALSLTADGQTPVPIQIVLAADQEGAVTLEASGSYWMMDALRPGQPRTEALVPAVDVDPDAPGLQVAVDADPAGSTYYLISPQLPTALEVRASLDQQRTRSETLVFVPVLRPLLAVGLLEARLDVRSLTDAELGLGRDRFEDALRTFQFESDAGEVTAGSRAALFLKGGVDLSRNGTADTELTLRLDSEEDERSRLFRDIQPDQFYSVYGDAGSRQFDAQSKGRFFGQLQRQGSFLAYGDFNTGLGNYGQAGARALGQYTRTLNGARQHFENENASVDAFASRDRFSQVVDELPGQGISGPYPLSRSDGLVGSERVELVTRDRNQPAVVLRSQVLERFTDYTIEPFSGRIIFKAPIANVDSEFNPQSIRVSYEVETGGEEFWVYGANGQFKPSQRLEVGGGIVRDDNPLSRFDLASVNATLELPSLFGGRTFLVGEFARTDSASVSSGDAGRVELRHVSNRFDGRLFYLGTDRAFNNPSSALLRGREEIGFRGVARVAPRTQLFAEFLRTEDRFSRGVRKGGRVAIEQAWGRWVRAQLGYRTAEETTASSTTAPTATSDPINAIGARVTAALPFLPNGSVFGEFEQDVSDSEQRRALFGGDYRLFDRARIYGRHEFISSLTGPYGLNPGEEQNNTIFGIAADYLAGQSIFSEYRARDAFQGRDAQAAIGLRNGWTLDDGIRLSTSLERLSPFNAGSTTATAVTGALEFTKSPLWRASVRTEYYSREGSDNLFGSVGYARKLTPDWTFLGNTVLSTMLDGDRAFERTRLGMAYRETGRNRWNALARYEHRYDKEPSEVDRFASVRAAHVFATNLNYQPRRDLVLRGQWASKIASLDRDGLSTSETAHLVGARGTLDVTEGVDLGLTGRALFSTATSTTQFGVGAEVGFLLADNIRLSGGYNLFGFRDEELSDQEHTDRGFYVQLGLKFDESSFGWGRADRGVPDSIGCGCEPPLSADIEVSITPAPSIIERNETVDFTITTTNRGELIANDVEVRAAIPHFEVASAEQPYSQEGDSILWDVGPLAVGASVRRTFSVRPLCAAPDTVLGVAASARTSTDETDPDNNTAGTEGPLGPPPCPPVDLIVEVFGPDTVRAGETVEFTVTTRNMEERRDALNVTDSLWWVAGIEPDSVVPLPVSVAARALTPDSSVRVGAMHQHTVWVTAPPVGAVAGDSIWIAGHARTSTVESDLTNNSDTAATHIIQAPPTFDLELDISDIARAREHSELEYVITTAYSGPGSAPASVRVVLPDGVTYLRSNRRAQHVGGVVTWPSARVDNVESLVDTVVVRCAAGTFRVSADVGVAPGEADAGNNADATDTECWGDAEPDPIDLDIEVFDEGPWLPGVVHRYRIVTTNLSEFQTLAARVTADLPSSPATAGLVSLSPGLVDWSRKEGATVGSSLVTWPALSLAPGASVEDWLDVVVPSMACRADAPAANVTVRSLVLSAQVGAVSGEVDRTNNRDVSGAGSVNVPAPGWPDCVQADTTEITVNFTTENFSVRPGDSLHLHVVTSNLHPEAGALSVRLEAQSRTAPLFRVPTPLERWTAHIFTPFIDLAPGPDALRWTPPIRSLAPGDSLLDSLIVVAPAQSGRFAVIANVTTESLEFDYRNNTDTAWVTVDTVSRPDRLPTDIAVSLDTLSTAACVVTFGVTTSHVEGILADSVRLSVFLPEGVEVLESPGAVREGNRLSWWQQRVTLSDNERRTDTLVVSFPQGADTVAVQAVVRTSTFELIENNNRDMTVVIIQDEITLTGCCDSCLLCPWPPEWWPPWWWPWILLLLIPLVWWMWHRHVRYGRVFAPCFRLWNVFRRKEIDGFIAELRGPATKSHATIRGVHDRIGGQPCMDWVLTEELMYSYRDVRSWSDIFLLWQNSPPRLKKKPKVRRLYAFALNRDHRSEDAEFELRKLIEEKGPDPHTCGILGRVYKDRWEDAYTCFIAGNCGSPESQSSGADEENPSDAETYRWASDVPEWKGFAGATDAADPQERGWTDATERSAAKARADALLALSIETYRQGHDSGPDNPYPGLNALTLSQFLPEQPSWYQGLADQVRRAAKSWAPDFKYWLHATRAELAILEQNPEEARGHLEAALAKSGVVWEVATTLRNLHLIRTAWMERDGSVVDWLEDMIETLAGVVDEAGNGDE